MTPILDVDYGRMLMYKTVLPFSAVTLDECLHLWVRTQSSPTYLQDGFWIL